ncbi:MAG: alpha/beta fold hydrolase [Hyphomicrobiaceae bacterium]|nr:alpha/beta fold hydrolase [Hyphomicrobiaceae bacterium]
MSKHLDWERDGADWPNRLASRFVVAAGFRWHVQTMGSGPGLLLLHGTGSSTHSFAELMPLLARHFTVITPDLPGHAFTGMSRRADVSLTGMALATAELLDVLAFRPAIVVGHSAGAAVLARMCLDRRIAPRVLVSLNGALLPFGGLAGRVFSPLARLVVRAPLVPGLIARRGADRAAVARLLANTGSQLPDRQIDIYTRLFANQAHVRATLDMMAQWDLVGLSRDLPALTIPLVLVAAGNDDAVRPETAFEVEERVPTARVCYVRGLGHLAHEEKPDEIAGLILDEARSAGLVE